jgi:predicted nucleic acid-binding protein
VILADTSVWVDHLRRGNQQFADLLEIRGILSHPFVIGELALGHLAARDELLRDLQDLPRCAVAKDAEVLGLIEHHRLFGHGIGYVDVHLLASVRITPGSSLWTYDKRLNGVAEALGMSIKSSHINP